MKIIIKPFWPAVVALIIATTLFCMPGEEFPQRDWFEIVLLDKWIHIGLFAGLVSLWCLPFISRIDEPATVRRIFIKVVLAFVAYGVAIEFIQYQFIPRRTFGIDDMIADTIGCFIGLFFSRWQLTLQTQAR